MKVRDTLMNMSENKTNSCSKSTKLRLKETAFTRKSKLGPKAIIVMLLGKMLRSLQTEIDEYSGCTEQETVSKQAFSKARKHLNPEFLREYGDEAAEICANATDARTYCGMRLIAVDGSTLAVENSRELKEHYGCSGSKKDSATARISLAFDTLNEAIYDFQIAPYSTGERELALAHVARLKELGLGGSLMIFDRGYPSEALMLEMLQEGFHFVMRVRSKWNLEVDAISEVEKEGYITLGSGNNTVKLRVIKLKLTSGEIETLITDLDEKLLPFQKASEIYFQRWNVEVAYDTLKSHLQLENFTGKSVISVEQDFYATVFFAQFSLSCAAEAIEMIRARDENKTLKYARKSNKKRTISKIRDNFYRIILDNNCQRRTENLEALLEEIALRPEPVRPNRFVERKLPRNKRFPMTKKGI